MALSGSIGRLAAGAMPVLLTFLMMVAPPSASAAGPAQVDDPQAALVLGIAYDLGQGVKSDPQAACTWYRRAGDGGLAVAEFNLAVMLDAGRCGPRDPAQAALWYSRAAARDHARAQYDLAQLYASGDGVPRNAGLARAWFDAAAKNGVAAAAQHLRQPATYASAPAPAAPLWPRDGAIDAQAPLPVPLVWTSTEQPASAQFYVEVYSLASATPTLVSSSTTPRSALIVTLGPGNYAWRVLTADANAARYVVSDRAMFSIGQGSSPH